MNNQEIKIGCCYISLYTVELYKTSYGLESYRLLKIHEIIFVLGIEDYMANDEVFNIKILTTDGFIGHLTIPKDRLWYYVQSTDR
jgi:hypothetical protein